MAAEHTFSHIVWTLQVYRCREEEALPLAAEGRALYAAAGHGAAAAVAGAADSGLANPAALAGAAASDPADPPVAADFAAARPDVSASAISGAYTAGPEAAASAESAGLFGEDPAPLERFADGTGNPEDAGALRWISRSDMANYAFPNVFLKLLNAYFDEQEGGTV